MTTSDGPAYGPAYGIIVAAGRSERMTGVDKIFAQVMGRPLLAWTLGAFKKCEAIEGVVVVAAPESVSKMHAFVQEWRFTNVSAVVPGGATRQESVRAGLEATDGAAIVAVHDAARLMVTPELIAQGVLLAREHGAAICGAPSRDTVKEIDGDPPVVRATPDRSRVWIAQTPQVFRRELLLRAHAAASDNATDDAALVEALGEPVVAYEGPQWNLKVTEPDDLVIAEALLRERFASV
ncbi:MAG TPA: 2-C-methyl-D-erythritol 4-phosphate cytidylyltransferase [Dehalococcoidia bacterium]